tara:strand:- start:50636 stop:50917 length:282 start_codon:yes stop_codon:yes gene_type:complete
MGLGILDDHALDHVPGTAQVLEGEQRREVERSAVRNENLKYDKTGTILLVPQPSDDPNDPLVPSPSPSPCPKIPAQHYQSPPSNPAPPQNAKD